MKCPFCGSSKVRKAGFNYMADGSSKQRYNCWDCRRTTLTPIPQLSFNEIDEPGDNGKKPIGPEINKGRIARKEKR